MLGLAINGKHMAKKFHTKIRILAKFHRTNTTCCANVSAVICSQVFQVALYMALDG